MTEPSPGPDTTPDRNTPASQAFSNGDGSLGKRRPRRSGLWREAFPDGLTVPASKQLMGMELPPDEDRDMMEDLWLPDPAERLEPMEGQDGPVRDQVPYGSLGPLAPGERALEFFQGLVATITYKPRYSLRADRDLIRGAEAGCLFRITYRVPDAYHPGELREFMQTLLIPPWLLERWGEMLEFGEHDRARDRMLRWVRKALGWHELHERDEFIRVAGEMVFDPHRGDPTGTRVQLNP